MFQVTVNKPLIMDFFDSLGKLRENVTYPVLGKLFYTLVLQVIKQISSSRQLCYNICLSICETERLNKAQDLYRSLAHVHSMSLADVALL